MKRKEIIEKLKVDNKYLIIRKDHIVREIKILRVYPVADDIFYQIKFINENLYPLGHTQWKNLEFFENLLGLELLQESENKKRM